MAEAEGSSFREACCQNVSHHSMVCALSLHGMCYMSVNTHANTISERWMRNIDTYMKEYIISMEYQGSKGQSCEEPVKQMKANRM